MSDIPEIGSTWEHTSGGFYVVLHIANMPDEPRYPRTVVYRNAVGAIWTRPVADWHRSMMLVTGTPPATARTAAQCSP